MTVDDFFELFLSELEGSPDSSPLHIYYKYHQDTSKLNFRRAYFSQRLQYVYDSVRSYHERAGRHPVIWDCGSGYSTTQIFLAINGYASRGTTLEFYYNHLPARFDYWSQYGDMSLIETAYENLFTSAPKPESHDLIIVQDTLHHIEPLGKGLDILYRSLKIGGELIVVEENGRNLMQRAKLYRQRGNERIIELYDEQLGQTIQMGNENIRSLAVWRALIQKAGFTWQPDSVEYVRLLPAPLFNLQGRHGSIALEQGLTALTPLREFFFFGLNFRARRPD